MKKGDLPVYFKDDWAIYPMQGVWVETVDEDQVENSDLEVGQPIICINLLFVLTYYLYWRMK